MDCPTCQAPTSPTARFCERCGAMLLEPADPQADPMIGRVLLDRYRVLASIGQGGMGAVYLAEQRMGQATRKVAIKALRRDLVRDAQLVGRFHRESEIVIQLQHPNIIQFHDFGELADGTLFLVMEYIDGETLQALLRRTGPLPLERVEHLLEQIVGALEEAHRRGVVHRDLKPQNILITQRAGDPDFVKVVDFGIAMRSSVEGSEQDTRLTSHGTVIGTPAYMSPEQFRGEEPDARADVYSLAVITYEMLAGKLPLQARTPWEWASQHLTAEPEPLEGPGPTASVPSHANLAVMRGLHKDREQRWADARSFLGAFRGQSQASLAPTRVVAVRPSPPPAPAQTKTAPEDSQELPLAQTAQAAMATPVPSRRGVLGAWLAGAGALLAAGAVLAFIVLEVPSPASQNVQTAASTALRERPRATRSAAPRRPLADGRKGSSALEPQAASPGDPEPASQAQPVHPGANDPPEPPPQARPAQGSDPNQLLADEGRSALGEGRLDFALTALETAQAALGSDDASVTALRAALQELASAQLRKLWAAGRCDEARRASARLSELGLAASPDPLAQAGKCTPAAEEAPPTPRESL